jgi:hypothetical protein
MCYILRHSLTGGKPTNFIHSPAIWNFFIFISIFWIFLFDRSLFNWGCLDWINHLFFYLNELRVANWTDLIVRRFLLGCVLLLKLVIVSNGNEVEFEISLLLLILFYCFLSLWNW